MPRKVFTAGEVLAASDVNTYLMNQAVMTFAGSASRSSAISTATATEGMVTYLEDTNKFEFWNGASYETLGAVQVPINFLVVAGGGGGGSAISGFVAGGGGGGGGYRNSHGTSGANSPAETAFDITPAINYLVTVGAGGAQNTIGANSVFASILSYGGGKGGDSTANTQRGAGGCGGGGGGATEYSNIGFGIPLQGINGSTGYINSAFNQGGGGGGGGASATGGAAALAAGASGGAGLASTITGSSVTRAGGGGGGAGNTGTSAAAGGSGGGGNGGATTGGAPTAGTANTGGGGGGGARVTSANAGAAGGSGVVILRYANTYTITLGAGLTGTTATDGASKVTTITAGTGNVSWA